MDVSAATTEIVELASVDFPAISRNYTFVLGADGIIVNDIERYTEDAIQLYPYLTYASGTIELEFDTGLLANRALHNYDALYIDGGYVRFEPSLGISVSYTGDIDQFVRSVVNVNPYIVINGVKSYLANGYENQVYFNHPIDSGVYLFYGADVEIIISYDEQASSLYDAQSYLSKLTVSLNDFGHTADLVGYRYTSTGDEAVSGSVSGLQASLETLLTAVNEKLDSIISKRFDISLTSLRNSLKSYIDGFKNSLLEDLDVWQSDQDMQDGLQNELQQEQNELVGTGNELQEEGNQLQEEANETSKNIFDKIAEFFGSFFGNFIDALKGLFVPDEGYFEDFFDRMSTFFSEKLGALYAPIDIFLRVLDAFSDVDATDPGIRFPGFAWQGTYIINPQTVKLSEYIALIPGLQDMIYFITNVIMVGAVLWLLQVKLREVLKN